MLFLPHLLPVMFRNIQHTGLLYDPAGDAYGDQCESGTGIPPVEFADMRYRRSTAAARKNESSARDRLGVDIYRFGIKRILTNKK